MGGIEVVGAKLGGNPSMANGSGEKEGRRGLDVPKLSVGSEPAGDGGR